MGSGHQAGGADHASGVGTAGTVAKIDLRLLHHPDCEVASADSGTSARIILWRRPASAATCQSPGTACPSYAAPLTATVRCVPPSHQQRAPRAAASVAMANGPPAWEQEPRKVLPGA